MTAGSLSVAADNLPEADPIAYAGLRHVSTMAVYSSELWAVYRILVTTSSE